MKYLISASAITGGLMFMASVGSLIAPIFDWNPWGSVKGLFYGSVGLLVIGTLLICVSVVGKELFTSAQPPDDDRFYRK